MFFNIKIMIEIDYNILLSNEFNLGTVAIPTELLKKTQYFNK